MFESLVSRLTSPPVSRRRHTVHAAREVCSEPEEEAAPVQRRSRAAKQLLDKRRKARLSCADLTTATNGEPERTSRMDALKAFLPLRQSKSLGRLDGLKEGIDIRRHDLKNSDMVESKCNLKLEVRGYGVSTNCEVI
ncbi:putative Rho GTPase activating protein 20 [Danaus plexippus plexippus]|uniref:Rho GTPase activating protein 20 n=1 Tax=Danaus plexippus plexippus TaxID=278856 RepID=A0A212F8D3_DANPL|nr:putative Rho GTPase activating protein 20 [Danaus plexippus plexippus]